MVALGISYLDLAALQYPNPRTLNFSTQHSVHNPQSCDKQMHSENGFRASCVVLGATKCVNSKYDTIWAACCGF